MTTINRSREVCTMLHTKEHFVIFDDDDAGDGRDNMLEGAREGTRPNSWAKQVREIE